MQYSRFYFNIRRNFASELQEKKASSWSSNFPIIDGIHDALYAIYSNRFIVDFKPCDKLV